MWQGLEHLHQLSACSRFLGNLGQLQLSCHFKQRDAWVRKMHSEDDQIVPYVAAGPLSAKLLKNGTLKTYKDLPHGMPTTHAETINADLLAFLKG
jgi:pimeloyl-ACP methyl ester carboxylesterase